jgi:hypothetical protein
MQNNPKMEIPYYSGTETPVPHLFPRKSRSVSVSTSAKKIRFCFANFLFVFHIFIPFMFFGGKVVKFLLHFNPLLDRFQSSGKKIVRWQTTNLALISTISIFISTNINRQRSGDPNNIGLQTDSIQG